MQETVSNINPPLSLNVTMFWIKLFTGGLFGILSYFMRRFYFEWEFLWAASFFAVLSYIIGFVIVTIFNKKTLTNPKPVRPLRTAAAYTGTWMMSYLLLGGLCFLGGW